MARSVADLVLVRGDFAVVPEMVAEGRQILRNIQRVAQLFVTKSVFVAVAGLTVAIPTATFPLLPRQFSIAAELTIGIPAFVLALAPSSGPWRPDRFLQSVARFAIPAGIMIGDRDRVGYLLARYGFDLSLPSRVRSPQASSSRAGSAWYAARERIRAASARCRRPLCRDGPPLHVALAVPFLRDFYELATPTGDAVAAWAVGVAIGLGGMLAALRLVGA